MSQCKEAIKFSKGWGYDADETYRVVQFCLLEKGHEGPHVISTPEIFEEP